MKTTLLFKYLSLVIVLSSFNFYSLPDSKTTNSVVFKDLTWQQTLQQAKQEDKLIFVDVYTRWCLPCKKLKKETFTNDKLANFFNTHFINVAYDAEWNEGIEVAKKLQVKAYPSMFLLDKNGKIVKTIIGYHNAEDLLEILNDVLHK